MNVDRKQLAELVRRSGKPQNKLAIEIGVDAGTVSRWLRGAVTRIRPSVSAKLCKALNCTPEQVSGEEPLPPIQHSEPSPLKGQLNVRIHPRNRNALRLVAERFGIDQQLVVELAPLLFFVAAERSIQNRRDQLAAIREAYKQVEKCAGHIPLQLPSIEQVLEWEEHSIRSNDVQGTKLALEIESLFIDESDDEAHELLQVIDATWGTTGEMLRSDPLFDFLANELASLPDHPGTEPTVEWDDDASPQYSICPEEAGEFAGHDFAARVAIERGLVSLHEMPRELTRVPTLVHGQRISNYNKISDAPEAAQTELFRKRAEWVRSKIAEEYGGEFLSRLDGLCAGTTSGCERGADVL